MTTTTMAAGTAATASGRPRGLTTANASTRIRNNPEMASTASVYGDARRARAFIVRSVRTGSRTPLLQRRGHTRSEPPGVDEEPRVAGATVTWPDRQPLGVPFAHHDLDAARLQPASMDPQGVHRASQLRGRRDVAAEHAAGLQHLLVVAFGLFELPLVFQQQREVPEWGQRLGAGLDGAFVGRARARQVAELLAHDAQVGVGFAGLPAQLDALPVGFGGGLETARLLMRKRQVEPAFEAYGE